jgi:hypothetical protein
MKTKITVILFTALAAILILMLDGEVSNANEKKVAIERNDIKLQVPQRYLFENQFSWIDQATGLDSNRNSFLIKIPANEIMKLFPDKISKDNPHFKNLIVLIYLLSSSEKEMINTNAMNTYDEIINKRSSFEGAYQEQDTETGWSKIYQSPRLNYRWYVFLNSPYSNKYLSDVNDLIALCQNDNHIGTQCGMFAKTFNDVAIELSLNYEHLPYYKDVQNYVIELLDSWRTN